MVMLNAGLITMLSAWVLVCAGVLESVAETVKFEVPAAVGVPEIVPEALRFKPVGKLPWLMLQVMASCTADALQRGAVSGIHRAVGQGGGGDGQARVDRDTERLLRGLLGSA